MKDPLPTSITYWDTEPAANPCRSRPAGVPLCAGIGIGFHCFAHFYSRNRDIRAVKQLGATDPIKTSGSYRFLRGVLRRGPDDDGAAKNKRGKDTKKTPVMFAVERDGEARAAVLPGIKAADFEPLVRGWVASDATLMTDGSDYYNFIPSAFLVHHRVLHSKKQFAIPATGAHVNTAEAFRAFIERARVGVYHRITGYHTQRYLDELTWRWNRREPVETDPDGFQGEDLKTHSLEATPSCPDDAFSAE